MALVCEGSYGKLFGGVNRALFAFNYQLRSAGYGTGSLRKPAPKTQDTFGL